MHACLITGATPEKRLKKARELLTERGVGENPVTFYRLRKNLGLFTDEIPKTPQIPKNLKRLFINYFFNLPLTSTINGLAFPAIIPAE